MNFIKIIYVLLKALEKRKSFKLKEPSDAYKIPFVKRVDDSWDFRKANTKEYTHCFHSYPAMMIPQVARRLIHIYGREATLLFDPYCGTGTSLVEANLQGINAIGTDLNPLARLIAITKTTRLNVEQLEQHIDRFNDYSFKLNFIDKLDSINIPKVTNIDFWFSKIVQIKLALILDYINRIKNESIKNFFKVAFSETIRESSFSKLSEFKLVRNRNFSQESDNDVFGNMISKLNRNRKGLIEYINNSDNKSISKVYDFNTVYEIPKYFIEDESVDLVITSPPYGDSKTTVAYGQFSRLSNEWLGFQEANQIDNKLMGGKRKTTTHKFKSELLNNVIQMIHEVDKDRAKDVISFYTDYEKSITNISRVVKSKGIVCFVVGNRTVKGIIIPNDEITIDFFTENGFVHLETIIRNIPNKRMPLKNSPSNIVGQTSSTMRNEYIVVCQKAK